MKYWFGTIHRTAKRDAVAEEFALAVLRQHTNYFKNLGANGKCLAAGPFAEQNADHNGAGFYILAAETKAKARELAAADPLVVEGLYDFRLREWLKVVPE
jgi:uncharacterized protein YciI